MIKIRYRDPNELSPGLHAAVERHGRTTTVYLLAGLSGAERRAALRRVRMAARRGYGPRLPGPQMALAHLCDRIRTALVRTGSVLRLHPAGSTVPVMLLSAGAIAFLVVSAVSMRVGQHSDSADSLPIISAISAHGPGRSPGPAGPISLDPRHGYPGRQGSGGGSHQQGYVGGGASGGYDAPTGSPSPTAAASTPTGSPSPASSPSPTSSPSPSPSPSRPTPLPSPSTVQPAPTPTPGNAVACVPGGGTQACLLT